MKLKNKMLVLLACIPQLFIFLILLAAVLVYAAGNYVEIIQYLTPVGDFISENGTAALVILAVFLLWYGIGNFCLISYKRGRYDRK